MFLGLTFLGTSAGLLAPLHAVAHPLTHTGLITRLGVEGEVATKAISIWQSAFRKNTSDTSETAIWLIAIQTSRENEELAIIIHHKSR